MTEPKPSAHDLDVSAANWLRGPGDTSEEQEIEIAFVDEYILMRNGADPDGPTLVFTQAEWDAFAAGAKDGEFDFGEANPAG